MGPYVFRSYMHIRYFMIFIEVYTMCVCVLGLGEIKLNQLQSQYHWECQKELIGYRFESLRI